MWNWLKYLTISSWGKFGLIRFHMLMRTGTISVENNLALASKVVGRYIPWTSNSTGKTLADVRQELGAALFWKTQNWNNPNAHQEEKRWIVWCIHKIEYSSGNELQLHTSTCMNFRHIILHKMNMRYDSIYLKFINMQNKTMWIFVGMHKW